MKLDAEFFEPFRGNIREINSDGYVEVYLRDRIDFDRSIILYYFDNPVIHYDNNWPNKGVSMRFSGIAKTQELRDLLFSMFATITIQP